MTFELIWDRAGAMLIVAVAGAINSEETQSALKDIIRCLDQADQSTHILADWRYLTEVPGLTSVIFSIFELLLHHNLGWIAFVGPPTATVSLIKVVFNRAPFRHRIFQTVEEAARFLREVKAGDQ